MTAYGNPRLITPPREEEEIYPYRRVWRSLLIENALLVGITMLLFVPSFLLGLRLPVPLVTPINIALVLLPAAAWVFFSYLAEARAAEPRRQLLAVFVITALVAQALAVPLVEQILQPATWLSLESAVNRIIGYTVTTGITHQAFKYIVLRLTVTRDLYRVREDSLAYNIAIAVAYATVLNLHYLADHLATPPDIVALRVLTTIALHVGSSAILSYGLIETLLSNALFILPATLVVAAALEGVAVPLRAGLVNSELSLDGGAIRPLFGFVFALALLVVPLVIVAFLYRNANRRAADVARGQEV